MAAKRSLEVEGHLLKGTVRAGEESWKAERARKEMPRSHLLGGEKPGEAAVTETEMLQNRVHLFWLEGNSGLGDRPSPEGRQASSRW